MGGARHCRMDGQSLRWLAIQAGVPRHSGDCAGPASISSRQLDIGAPAQGAEYALRDNRQVQDRERAVIELLNSGFLGATRGQPLGFRLLSRSPLPRYGLRRRPPDGELDPPPIVVAFNISDSSRR